MDPLLRAHQEWIGMAQPEGLVVTASVLHTAEANLTWPVTEQQAQLRELLSPDGLTVRDLRALLVELLGWPDALLIGRAEMPPELHAHIEGAGESPRPDFALRSAEDPTQFVILVCQIDPPSLGLDAATDDKRWTATPQQRCERLLRETGVPVGLLSNGRALRLIYAPKGESVGHVTFAIADLLSVDGRPLLGALLMLLSARRLLSLDAAVRLPALLQRSREYQNTVSNALREQVLGALRELLVGFQDADRLAAGQLLGNYRREHLQEVYTGLVTVLMRMVFVLYAEERGLLPMESPLYADSYSLTRLHAQLVEDRSRYGDGLDARYGAWARSLALFRILYDGVDAADGLHLPARRGDFFHPDRFPFLEGRPRGASRQVAEVLQLPKISDGVMFRVLDQLLLLGGERLQYRGLDVEQVGSVYEGLMGFEIEVAAGPSLCLSPQHVVMDLEQLLQKSAPERLKTLKEEAGLDAKGELGNKVKDATSVEALHQALGRRISPRQPGLFPMGSLYLQPGQERRRTGSHYTPRALTQPIVETALRPILERLGPDRTPAQLLGLKICDPAMGSGAFLVEACRQLADHLVTAWRKSGQLPELPPDEDLVLHARRLVAQRCLYGVDKNPLAADLARLSLWLVTFAREHPFTFVDHALRCGDSLVGLSREQICSLTWLPIEKGIGNKAAQVDSVRALVDAKVKEAESLRGLIHAQGDPPDTAELFHLWTNARDALELVRMLGDVTISVFFSATSAKERTVAQEKLVQKVQHWLATGSGEPGLRGMVAELRDSQQPIIPFHWQIEFPEVFAREDGGFDCFVGNPPFLGGTRISTAFGYAYLEWLMTIHPGGTGNVDLVAHFLRQAFALSRPTGGTTGLIATNSIAQGDTRELALSWICSNGGVIYDAYRRYRWPGAAAVVVSTVHFARGGIVGVRHLDGKSVKEITSFLFHSGGNFTPEALSTSRSKCFVGSKVQGIGFVFDDGDAGATPLSELHRLKTNTHNADRIFEYIGGEDLNTDPQQRSGRYIIDFGEMPETDARKWPELFSIVEAKVKPARATVAQRDRRELWWLHATRSPETRKFLTLNGRCLAIGQVSTHFAFSFVMAGCVFSHSIVLILLSDWASFGLLQSRVHEAWARFIGTSMKDDLRYTTECFDTFPRLEEHVAGPLVAEVSKEYYLFRASLMVNEGLTKIYNRFHDSGENSVSIIRLRELHAKLDRAVLNAYGWQEIEPTYDFRPQLDDSIRFTWSEDTRDEVLALLLERNRQLANAEAQQRAADAVAERAAQPPKPARGRKKKPDDGSPPSNPTLPGFS